MADHPPAKNGTAFKLALLAMLVSIWLIGRAGQPLPEEEPVHPGDMHDDPQPHVEPPVIAKVVTEPIDPMTPGSVVGIVKFVGRWPAPKPITLNLDSYCSRLYEGREELLSERWLMGEHQTVQNTFLYISAGLPDKPWPILQQSPIIEMRDCRFAPHVMAVQRDQVVEIRNMDQTLHSPNLVTRINHGIQHVRPPTDITLWMAQKIETDIYLKCDVHPWMNAYLHVLDHPFFDVTGPQGSYEIKNLPPGEYELSLWHEVKAFRNSVQPVKVRIEPGKTTTIDFTIKPASND